MYLVAVRKKRCISNFMTVYRLYTYLTNQKYVKTVLKCLFLLSDCFGRRYLIYNSLDFVHRSHCFDHRTPGKDSTETHHERQILQGVFHQERYTCYMINRSANVPFTYLRNLLAVFNSLAWTLHFDEWGVLAAPSVGMAIHFPACVPVAFLTSLFI